MGNYSFLYASNNDHPPPLEPDGEHTDLFQAKYSIPALWFTLFTEARVYTPDPDEEPDYTSRFLIVSRDDAWSRLRDSIPQLRAIFGNADPYCDRWVRGLKSTDFRYLKADVDEVLDMSSEDQLTPALAFLRSPDAHKRSEFLSLTNIAEVLADGVLVDRSSSQSQLSTFQVLAGVSPQDLDGA